MEISVALGGGGIKGIAHIGVLECLQDSGFTIKAVAGTSAGALVGAMFAAGHSPREIQDIVGWVDQERMFKRQAKDRPALLGYAGLAEVFTAVLGEKEFKDLVLPFACTAVDTQTSQEIYLNEGRVVDAILASMAVPGVFPPKIIGEMELIDGSVLDPVPVALARALAPTLPVIAVALNPAREAWHTLPNFNVISPVPLPIPTPIVEGIARMRIAQAFQVFVHAMDISSRMLTELRLEVDKPEVIIRPDVFEYGMLDNVVPEKLILAGHRAAERANLEIRKSLSLTNTMIRIWRGPSGFKRKRPDKGTSPKLSTPHTPE